MPKRSTSPAASAARRSRVAVHVKISIADVTGRVIRTIDGTKRAGINRVTWNLTPNPPPGAQGGGFGFGGGRGGFAASVDPGTYVVTLEVAGKKLTKPVVVLLLLVTTSRPLICMNWRSRGVATLLALDTACALDGSASHSNPLGDANGNGQPHDKQVIEPAHGDTADVGQFFLRGDQDHGTQPTQHDDAQGNTENPGEPDLLRPYGQDIAEKKPVQFAPVSSEQAQHQDTQRHRPGQQQGHNRVGE